MMDSILWQFGYLYLTISFCVVFTLKAGVIKGSGQPVDHVFEWHMVILCSLFWWIIIIGWLLVSLEDREVI